MRNNIFIALNNKKTALSIAKILISEGISVTAVIKNVSDLTTTLSYYKNGTIITSCLFDGIHIDRIMDYVPDGYTAIVVGNKEQLNNCENDNLFKLAVPLHKNDLICALDMMSTFDSSYQPESNKSLQDEKLIDRAKHTLIDTYNMTEEQAHRYIQKKSMDTGRKLVEIAKIILEI
ncbi:MAG: ANTAR domain-containing response regulator [Lachnospirales bacterium]